MAIRTKNPATGEVVRTFDALSDADIEAKLSRAADTFRTYRDVPFAARRTMMEAAAAPRRPVARPFSR